MTENKFPDGWDEARVRRLAKQYEGQSDEEAVLEDEAGVKPSETVMQVPHELVQEVRELIAKRRR